MAGKNSKWLGPKRRKKEFGDESRGTPRPAGPDQFKERHGFFRGARVYR